MGANGFQGPGIVIGGTFRDVAVMISSHDSPLEGDGFEPSVPGRENADFEESEPSWKRQKAVLKRQPI